jgi:hypothetical protein
VVAVVVLVLLPQKMVDQGEAEDQYSPLIAHLEQLRLVDLA